jgi:hypothetical protein
MRSFLNKRPAEAVMWLERYDKASQDLLICLLPLAARLTERDLQKGDAREITAWVAQLDNALDSLRARAQLTIERMCFCSEIVRFGVYAPLDEDHEFRPGDYVQLYVEVGNFTSQQHGDEHNIRLASTVEIRKFDGEKVWEQVCLGEDRPDRSRTPRHDFFNNYWFIVPRIPQGNYVLKVQVTDVPTHRTAERTLDFRVGPGRGS